MEKFIVRLATIISYICPTSTLAHRFPTALSNSLVSTLFQEVSNPTTTKCPAKKEPDSYIAVWPSSAPPSTNISTRQLSVDWCPAIPISHHSNFDFAAFSSVYSSHAVYQFINPILTLRHSVPYICRTHSIFFHLFPLSSLPTLSIMPLKSSTKSQPKLPSSRHKPKSTLKDKSLPKPVTAPRYLVVDASLPSHVFNDQSLFTTYTPTHKLHRTPLGSEIVIQGIGDVHVRLIVKGVSLLFRFRDCWHVPFSRHHFLSSLATISRGKQIMLAGRTPRMIFPHKDRILDPSLPKYIPFTRGDGLFVLKFDVPAPTSTLPITQPTTTVPVAVPHTTRSVSHPAVSLHVSSSPPFAGLFDYQPFAGLTFTHPQSSCSSSPRIPLSPSPPSIYPLPFPQYSSSNSSSFPPTLTSCESCQQLPSGFAVDVNMHRRATGYTSVDFASHGDADAPVNMDGLVVLNQSGDVGVNVGLHGGVNMASTSTSESQQQPHLSSRRSLVPMNVSSSDPHLHFSQMFSSTGNHTTPFPVGHPYNLPPPASPSTPRTTSEPSQSSSRSKEDDQYR